MTGNINKLTKFIWIYIIVLFKENKTRIVNLFLGHFNYFFENNIFKNHNKN